MNGITAGQSRAEQSRTEQSRTRRTAQSKESDTRGIRWVSKLVIYSNTARKEQNARDANHLVAIYHYLACIPRVSATRLLYGLRLRSRCAAAAAAGACCCC